MSRYVTSFVHAHPNSNVFLGSQIQQNEDSQHKLVGLSVGEINPDKVCQTFL